MIYIRLLYLLLPCEGTTQIEFQIGPASFLHRFDVADIAPTSIRFGMFSGKLLTAKLLDFKLSQLGFYNAILFGLSIVLFLYQMKRVIYSANTGENCDIILLESRENWRVIKCNYYNDNNICNLFIYRLETESWRRPSLVLWFNLEDILGSKWKARSY